METGRIFSRSLELLWKFKFLLLFGFVMGVTGGGGASFNGNFSVDRFGDTPFLQGFQITPFLLVLGGVLLFVFFIVWLVLFLYFRFVSRGALVSSVRDIESTGTATLQTAWANGRKYYGRLLGLGFAVNVPLILFTLLVLGLSLVLFIPPVLTLINQRGRFEDALGLIIPGVFALCCAVICIVVVTIVIHPLYEFAVRAIVLEELSVGEGIRRGIQQARAHLGEVVIAYILLIGARIGWGLAIGIVSLPIVLALTVPLFAGGRPDFNLLIVVFLIAAIPLWLLFGFLEGVFQTFESNVWTEVYLALNKQLLPAPAEATE
jgi:hypothetical protein